MEFFNTYGGMILCISVGFALVIYALSKAFD